MTGWRRDGRYALSSTAAANDAFSDAATATCDVLRLDVNASSRRRAAHAGDGGGTRSGTATSRTDGLIHVDTCGSDVDTLLGVTRARP